MFHSAFFFFFFFGILSLATVLRSEISVLCVFVCALYSGPDLTFPF